LRPIIGFCGGQGSGKTSHSDALCKSLVFHTDWKKFGIKSTFTQYITPVIASLAKVNPEFDSVRALKSGQLAISTWAESIDPNIWSDIYKRVVEKIPESVITDDIRTEANLRALMELSLKRPVIVFKLVADAETRKKRTSVWRDNGGYTEAELFNPPIQPAGADWNWHHIDTTEPFEKSRLAIESIVLDALERRNLL
jgi:hypothetical protein